MTEFVATFCTRTGVNVTYMYTHTCKEESGPYTTFSEASLNSLMPAFQVSGSGFRVWDSGHDAGFWLRFGIPRRAFIQGS